MEEDKLDNKLLCSIFFTKDEINDDNYICCKCDVPRKKGNGWTNLTSHIFSVHKNEWKEELKKNTTTSSGPMDKWMVKKATPKPTAYAKNVYGWVDYMLNRNESPSTQT